MFLEYYFQKIQEGAEAADFRATAEAWTVAAAWTAEKCESKEEYEKAVEEIKKMISE